MEEKLIKLYAQCVNELKSIGIDLGNKEIVGDIDIRLSPRASKRYGCCKQEEPDRAYKNIEKYGHRHIIKYEKFNKHHIEVSKWVMQLNEDIIKNTIIHEIIHCFPYCNNHGQEFKKYAVYINKKLGYNVTRTGNVKEDFENTQNKFHIKYIKNRNVLQTMTFDEKGNEKIYGTGSHARHTLIQLCGYLVFMKLLIEENKYPIIPLIVIDHISKPFSDQNVAAIGTIIHAACEKIGISNLQIFIFDDKDSDILNISPNYKENLFNNEKTGFNPFFKPNA